eukprot:TRINITY_DN74610_c0_g1_i1.p1 TRINITY_DN74610_c0_g1~~TRINITY_DN74610_c0_g1_i1.p1  ORF type:complete len:309 (-),score=79.92 TRINITY_DN74610_c0_g1_i1:112-978(-)
MADRFSETQVQELAAAVPKVDKEAPPPATLHGLVAALRASAQTAFSAAEVESISSAAAALDVPLEARPKWESARGRGLFVVFEGLDRSGKSTQSKRLTKHLEEAPGGVKWRCFPDRSTPSGALIDLYLRNKIELSDNEVHLLFSANRWEASKAIIEDLNKGTSVVCDRYAFSGVAYSSAKGLDFTWCQTPDRGLPLPDAVFFLHIDEKVGASRSNFGDERYENASMQARVREQFKLEGLRAGVNWHDVDGARDIEVISAEIREAVESVKLAEQENGARPVQRLWATLA